MNLRIAVDNLGCGLWSLVGATGTEELHYCTLVALLLQCQISKADIHEKPKYMENGKILVLLLYCSYPQIHTACLYCTIVTSQLLV